MGNSNEYIVVKKEVNLFVEIGKLEFPEQNACIAIAKCDMRDIDNLSDNIGILSKDEQRIYQDFKYEKRQKDYLLGRYAAKTSVETILQGIEIKDISVLNGIFHQPYLEIKGNNNPNLQISMTHSNGIAIALAFTPNIICGIDLERICNQKTNAMRTVLTVREKSMLLSQPADALKFLTTLWTAKESLAKILCAGFMCKQEILEISDVCYKNQCLIGNYLYFPQYRYMSKEIGGFCLTFALPRNLEAESLFEFTKKEYGTN